MKNTREILKTYFETGDYPTEAQFVELIDSFAHLDEFNFGLDIKVKGEYKKSSYHFYIANDIQYSGVGHKTIIAENATPPTFANFIHKLTSNNVLHKELEVSLVGNINIEKHKPKIIIERYKQKKKLPSGYIKPSGYYQESQSDAQFWGRQSEYEVTSQKMTLDIDPIHYFRPNSSLGSFSPSGSKNKTTYRSYKYKHAKPFVPIRLKLEINIDGIAYQSKPLDLKIVLGTAGIYDAINYFFD